MVHGAAGMLRFARKVVVGSYLLPACLQKVQSLLNDELNGAWGRDFQSQLGWSNGKTWCLSQDY